MYEDGRVRKNRIVDIYYSGKRKTYRIITASGASIVCTENHKFPTPDGKRMLRDLRVGDTLYRCGEYEKTPYKDCMTDGISHNYPVKGQCGFQ